MQAEYRSGTSVVRKGMIRSFMSIFKEEGARGLYRDILGNPKQARWYHIACSANHSAGFGSSYLRMELAI